MSVLFSSILFLYVVLLGIQENCKDEQRLDYNHGLKNYEPHYLNCDFRNYDGEWFQDIDPSLLGCGITKPTIKVQKVRTATF